MTVVARVKIRMDFCGEKLGKPEIIEFIPEPVEANLLKSARIYARMIKIEVDTGQNYRIAQDITQQKSKRKSC
ncbi:MAG: hypothetical protein PHG06_06775 [Parabacteroides sp.]|nr:hypothetical protein [Parabacteroides sp.]